MQRSSDLVRRGENHTREKQRTRERKRNGGGGNASNPKGERKESKPLESNCNLWISEKKGTSNNEYTGGKSKGMTIGKFSPAWGPGVSCKGGRRGMGAKKRGISKEGRKLRMSESSPFRRLIML